MKKAVLVLMILVGLVGSIFAETKQKQVSDCTMIQYDTDYVKVFDRARFTNDSVALLTSLMEDAGWTLTGVFKGWMPEDWANVSWAIPYVDVYGMAIERYVNTEGNECSFYYYYYDDSFGFDKETNYYVIQLNFVK